MAPILENGKPIPKRQRVDEELSSGPQVFTGDKDRSRCNGPPSDKTYRINDLPNCILEHILSYLPAPEVVRTSILSTQWRNIWTDVPCLQAEDPTEFEGDEAKCINFVSSLLYDRSEEVSLKVLNVYSPQCEELNSWISYAMDNKVESLKYVDDTVLEPFILDKDVNFRSSYLNTLVLSNVSLAAAHFNQLNNHCPNLKILRLEAGTLNTFGISSSSLTSLYIKNFSTPGDMLISAPNLTLLRFINSGNKIVSLEKLPLLVEASVVLRFNIVPAAVNWNTLLRMIINTTFFKAFLMLRA